MILGILLAAGASRRMGCDKLDLPWQGTTVLGATLDRWAAVPELDGILLVRRHPDPAGERPRVRLIVHDNADEGMGSSFRLAANALPPGTEAVVFGFADMPKVAPATIAALIAAWRPLGPRAIVAPIFDGKRGHPVVFGAHHFPALRELTGDQGGRAILQRHAADVKLFSVDDPGVTFDLDTPADLEARE